MCIRDRAHLDGQQIRLVINYSDDEGYEEEITTDAITIPHLEIDTSSSVLEGDRLSINIKDSSLKGETIYYSLTGIDEDDLSQGSLSG